MNVTATIGIKKAPDFSDAHFYLTKADAESEIEIDNHGLDYFNIFEVIIKSWEYFY